MEGVALRDAVFVDTSGWYALADPGDAEHPAAVRRFRRLGALRRLPVTTNQVVGESYTLLRTRLGFRPAHELLVRMRRTSFVHRVFVSETWEEEAERLLEQHDD
jgi:predicted nucleic acid-binding protein